MLYTVYVWEEEGSQEAGIVGEVEVSTVGLAIEQVMGANGLTSAFYVWVISEDGEMSEEFFAVDVSASGG